MPPLVGKINKILSHSFVDGPGNRCVIFMQGCPFRCLYCHNPYTINFCSDCGACVPLCPVGALKLEAGRVCWDPAVCVDCDTCINACPYLSSPKIHHLTVEETWEKVRSFAPFISGVTVSGGEPTLQPDFLAAFLRWVKSASDLTTCIETNGDFPEAFLDELLPVLDFAMVDLKAFDRHLHRQLTGSGNDRTLAALQAFAHAGKLHMVRTTVVPGYTDSEENIRATARFLADLAPDLHLRLLRFRAHGVRGQASDWDSPSDALLDRLVEAARAEGLNHVDHSI
jgi:pyruvate formate lyase activating enzyme